MSDRNSPAVLAAAGSLLVITGPPGAGKSTVSAELARRSDPSVLVHGDDFFSFLATGAIEPWLPESNAQNSVVTEAAARATGRFAQSYATFYDGVVGPWLLEEFGSASGLASLDYAILLPPVETCVSRVATRVGHGFTDEGATRKMHAEFSTATIDRRHIIDTHNSISATVAAILDARSTGALHHSIR